MAVEVDKLTIKKTELSSNNSMNDIFHALKNRASNDPNVTAPFSCIYQTAIDTFQQDTGTIDIILRKLVECAATKEHAKCILIALLRCSTDVSFNFENKVEEITFKSYLKAFIDDILSDDHDMVPIDYELLCAIAEINPLLAEEVTTDILEQILYGKRQEREEIGVKNLIKTLWMATVRLRRQHKFLPKLLQCLRPAVNGRSNKLKSQFKLPDCFLEQIKEDLETRTTNSQVLAMFRTANYHFRTCINDFTSVGNTAEQCSLVITIVEILVNICTNFRFFENSSTTESQSAFFSCIVDLRDTIVMFTEKLQDHNIDIENSILEAVIGIIYIWGEVYTLMRYHLAPAATRELDFPVTKAQMKELKKLLKNSIHKSSLDAVNQLGLVKSINSSSINEFSIKPKAISDVWDTIVKNHCGIMENLNESQNLQIASLLVEEATSSEENFNKWTTIIDQNVTMYSKQFVTSLALQTVFIMSKNLDSFTISRVLEKYDIVEVTTSEDVCKNILKNLKKEINKDVNSLSEKDLLNVKQSLKFLSKLPLIYIDGHLRILLFLIVYCLERQSDKSQDVVNIYLDLLQQNDINVVDYVPDLSQFVADFSERKLVVSKIFKISITSLATFGEWKEFFNSECCTQKLCFIFLTCLENIRGKQVFKTHKTSIQDLLKVLINKFMLELNVNDNPEDLTGLAITLKTIALSQNEVDKPLCKYIKATIKEILKDSDLRTGSMQLILVVLKHKECFKIKSSLRKQLCRIVMQQPCEKTFLEFLEIINIEEFKHLTHVLVEDTKNTLCTANDTSLKKLFIIWESLSKAEASAIRSKIFSIPVNKILEILQNLEMPEKSFLYAVKLCRILCNAKRMVLVTNQMVDGMLCITLRCLKTVKEDSILPLCGEVLEFLSALLKHQNSFVPDRLHVIVDIFKMTIRIVLQKSKDANHGEHEGQLKSLALKIEKLTVATTKLKKDLARLSPFFIADVVHLCSQTGVLPSYMKTCMESVTAHLLSVCDRHAVPFLSRTLPPATLQIFNTTFESYRKYHKFTGKI